MRGHAWCVGFFRGTRWQRDLKFPIDRALRLTDWLAWPPTVLTFVTRPSHPDLRGLKIASARLLRLLHQAHNNSFKPTPLRGAA